MPLKAAGGKAAESPYGPGASQAEAGAADERCSTAATLGAGNVGITTLTAGVLSIKNLFWPLTADPKTMFQGYLDSTLMVIFILGVVLVVIDAARRWVMTLRGSPIPKEAFGDPEVDLERPPMRCC